MDIKRRFELVKRNTAEILTEPELKNLLSKKKKPSAYIGVTPTGPFHIGYLISFTKLLDFSKASIENTILIADIHAALDDLKCKWSELDIKSEYYRKCIELGFPWIKKPKFVRGSDFQLEKAYVSDALKIATLATVKRATRAASEVTRMKNPKVSELIYPIMQGLDEEYLKADIQLGGIDQRHILGFAREYLPKIGHKARIEIMTPLVQSLRGPGVKMSASFPESVIKIYESEKTLKKKINNAYCPLGVIKENPILQLYQHFIFPIKNKVKIQREKKFGGDVILNNFEEMKKLYENKQLHPQDLKLNLTEDLIKIFSKVRKYFQKNQDLLKKLGSTFQ
ncbi:tyrosine--tRNA ligase [Candidatus Pacearchaeota archaeon ex4484_26]|nr:MAG: tyrosine--tRNA ligase [Candidatus Pacearchaeota archaeon ex4484_26]